MLFNIIFWASIIWVAPLVYYMLANETKFKKNIAVGVTLPLEGRTDEEVIKRLERFRKELRYVCIFLVVIAIACIFIPDIYATLSLWGLWIVLCIVLPYIPYVRCNKDLKEIKRKRFWQKETTEPVTVTNAPEIRWFSIYAFIPAFLLSIIPIILDMELFVIYIIDSVTIILFWMLYRLAYENRPEMVNDNMELTSLLTHIRKRNWGILWLVSSYLMSFLNLVIFLTQTRPILMLLSIFFMTAIFIIAVLRIEFATRKIQEELTKDTGRELYVDEDDSWIGGIIYYNPNDKKLFVNYRVGTNVTINAARPAGKIIFALTILLLVAIPFSGPILSQMGKKPIELYVKDNYVTAVNGGTEYSISLDNIEKMELLDKLPDGFTRINGTSFENLQKGTFSAKGIVRMKVILDPSQPPFILITTKDNKKYLFGSRDENLTKSIHEEISKNLQASQDLQP